MNKPLFLPDPESVLRAFTAQCGSKAFWHAIGASMARMLGAYILGVIVGVLLAVCTTRVPALNALLQPLLRAIRATPVSSFIILALVWLRRDWVPVLTGTLMVLPIVWGNVRQGISGTDARLLEMARMYRFGRTQTILRVYVPSIAPTFFAACETSLGLCWKASIAAEVLGTPQFAIGSQLHNAKVYLQTDALFAWTFTVILLSLCLETFLTKMLRPMIRQRLTERGRA